jgi:hypothetical protein
LKLFNCLVNERGFDSSEAGTQFGDAVFAQMFAFERSDNEGKECLLKGEKFGGQKTRIRLQLGTH